MINQVSATQNGNSRITLRSFWSIIGRHLIGSRGEVWAVCFGNRGVSRSAGSRWTLVPSPRLSIPRHNSVRKRITLRDNLDRREAPLQVRVHAAQDSNLQQCPRFGHADGWSPILAGRHPRQRHEMTPAEGRSRPIEFLRHSAIEFLRVQRPVFTDCVAQ